MGQRVPRLDRPDSVSVTTVNGSCLTILGKSPMKFVIDSHEFPFEARVIENLSYDVILGRDFLKEFCFKVDFENGSVNFPSEPDPLPFKGVHLKDDSDSTDKAVISLLHASRTFVVPPQSETLISGELNSLPSAVAINGVIIPKSDLHHRYSVFGASELVSVADDGMIPIRLVNPSFQPVKIYRRTRLADFEEVDQNVATFELNATEKIEEPSNHEQLEKHDYSQLPDLSDSILLTDDKVEFRDLFVKYRDVFALSDSELGRTSLVQHVIDTGDATPIKQMPYRTSPEGKQEIDRQVNNMLERGIVQESVSAWSSPVVLVKKKDCSMRFCVDYRKLNKVTKKDSFPLPLIADTLDSLSGTSVYSTLDMKAGYWQIELDPYAREKSAFVTHNGLYEFLVMPFGLTNSGASFQRLMGHILRGLKYRFALIYIGDNIIFSRSVEERLVHLEEVFRRLRQANVKLNPKKCSFVKQKVEISAML